MLKISNKHIFGALLCFLIFAFPSIINYHTDKALTAYGYLIGSSLVCFATYKAVQIPQYRYYVKVILWLLIILSAVAAVKGIYQYQFLHIDRPKGPFMHPNVLADHMEIMIPLCIATILGKRKLYIKALITVILLLLFGGLIVTLSRGALLAVVIAIIVMFVVEKNYKVLLPACATLGLAIIVRYNTVLERIRSIADLQFQSNAERLYGYYSSFEIIKTNPLIGIGFTNFGNIYPQFKLPSAVEILPHAHNVILVFATEAGVLAAIAFTVFICLSGMYLFNNFSHIANKNDQLLVLGIACGVLSLMLHGMVDYTIRRPSILLVFMFLVGLDLGLLKYYATGRHMKTISK